MTPIVLSSNPDCPVLDHGLVRVRYDPGTGYTGGTGTPGFRVDMWTGSAYAEQGKLTLFGNLGNDTTWVAASLVEWTPDRAVMLVVLANPSDPYSRDRMYVTVERGTPGVTFECYPALTSTGAQATCAFQWCPALNSGAADLNASVFKSDTQTLPTPAGTGKTVATAGTGAGTGNSGLFPAGGTALGNSNFTASENYVALLRCPTAYNVVGPYQTTFVVLQAANALCQVYQGTALGVTTDQVDILAQNAAGYLQTQVCFAPTVTDQVNEAESVRNAGSGTTSTVADATASGGNAVKDTQTASTASTLLKSSTTLLQAKYRVMARCKVDSGATGSFTAAIGAVAGGFTATSTSTAWTWLDLGDILAAAAGAAFSVNAWRSAGASGSVYIDRVELYLMEDHVRSAGIYQGSRDVAQSALMDSRTLGALTVRG